MNYSAIEREAKPSRLHYCLAFSVVCVIGLSIGLIFVVEKHKKKNNDNYVPPFPGTHITIVHINDLYEMLPVNNGKEGGMARVQTLLKQIRASNPNTLFVLAGDLISPSALSAATVDGEALNGRHMIDMMNYMGLDYMCFGNHEFDYGIPILLQRMEEARFSFVSSNCFLNETSDGRYVNFPNTNETLIRTVSGVRIGFVGMSTNAAIKPDTLTAIRFFNLSYSQAYLARLATNLKTQQQADIVIALTHNLVEDDAQTASLALDVDIIIGGHDHENQFIKRGDHWTSVCKADANVRSVYVHDLYFDASNPDVRKRLNIVSRLQLITSDLADDKDVYNRTMYWLELGFEGFEKIGFQPEAIVAYVKDQLDGRSSVVRSNHGLLTDMIAEAIRINGSGELSILNAGAVRIDDIIYPGNLTQYDVLRILPFSNAVQTVNMTGHILQQTLNIGEKNVGIGGFLHWSGVEPKGNDWIINGAPLDSNRNYTVATVNFLLSGAETNLEFLNLNNPEIVDLNLTQTDYRFPFITYLEQKYRSTFF